MSKINLFAFNLQHEYEKKITNLQMAIAWKLPRWLVKWAVVRAFAHASTGVFSKQDPTMLTYSEVMNRWDMKDNRGKENE